MRCVLNSRIRPLVHFFWYNKNGELCGHSVFWEKFRHYIENSSTYVHTVGNTVTLSFGTFICPSQAELDRITELVERYTVVAFFEPTFGMFDENDGDDVEPNRCGNLSFANTADIMNALATWTFQRSDCVCELCEWCGKTDCDKTGCDTPAAAVAPGDDEEVSP